MKYFLVKLTLVIALSIRSTCLANVSNSEGLPLYYWKQPTFVNFGDYLSLKLVEKIVGGPVVSYRKTSKKQKKLLAIGSILYFAEDGDVIWGSGINGKRLNPADYQFNNLDVRSVRVPALVNF